MGKFFNTTNETGEALKACRRAVNRQELKVLEKFKELTNRSAKQFSFYHLPPLPFTPSEIHKELPDHIPITSIRRAITNLTEAGYLRKTAVKIVGPWGRREHCWELIGE